jgi:hypothetical protein
MRTAKFVGAVSIALASLCGAAVASRADDGQTTLPSPMVWTPPAASVVVTQYPDGRVVYGTPQAGTVVFAPNVEGCVVGGPAVAEGRPHPISQGIRDCLQKHGWCCHSSFNSYTCGTLKSECKFIFGSCREFFGEPCLKGPPGPGDLAVTGYGNGCRHCGP